MAPFAGMLSGVAAPHVGRTSPIGFPLTFVQAWTRTWPFAAKVIHQASTVGVSWTMPPAPPALLMSTRDARKLLKLIGDLMMVRMFDESYLFAPFCSDVLPLTDPSA